MLCGHHGLNTTSGREGCLPHWADGTDACQDQGPAPHGCEDIQLFSKSWKHCRSPLLGEARCLQQAEIGGTDVQKSRAAKSRDLDNQGEEI